jgi:4-cresol dehydrogenase (hydroxylating)
VADLLSEQTERFAEAVSRIRDVVGDEHVLERWDEIEPRARDTLPKVRAPSALVFPADAEQVRAVVAIAHECKLPLWPISRGRNWAYGAMTPSIEGTVVLSLQRLNRIVEVNEELAYAVIEPGVTFAQLQEHLERYRIPLWIDPTDSTPYGSVVGNALDRGMGVTPYGDHFGNLCGMDVVLADGRLIQTPGSGTDASVSSVRHVYKWGTGPYLDGLFSQSGIGVVVKAGIWLTPEPEACCFYILEILREEDVPRVVDAARRLALGESVRTRIHLMNDISRLTIITRCPFPATAERTHLSDAERAVLRKRHGVPIWLLSGGLQGTRAEVQLQRRELQAALGPYGRLRFISEGRARTVQSVLAGIGRTRRLPVLWRPLARLFRRAFGKSVEMAEAVPHAFDRVRGRPTEYFLRAAYYKSQRPLPPSDVDPGRDGGGLIWVAPTIPFTGRHLTEALDLCRPLFHEYGFDFVVAVMPHNARSMAFIMGILYYKENPAEVARAEELYRRVLEVTAAAGYPLYRVSAPHQDTALAGTPAVREVADQVKRALDPDGIIAPGRYGLGQPQ